MSPLPAPFATLLAKAKQYRKENKKFILGLARRKDLDPLFHDLHDEVFARVDCLTCANCCKTTSPIFRDVDIDRISKHLGIRPSMFTEKYLHIDEDQDWVLNVAPCPFLGDDNYCSIYDVRPKACREYPHTDRKNMSQILELTFRNTMVCPAVADMVEKIKEKTK
ncbi:MAG: YkgJ family cysteine cluster protein [Flavobacteriales bacterium]|nr:YkgJ family cysteine cluster protein [Flavobacteriales bacterium]